MELWALKVYIRLELLWLNPFLLFPKVFLLHNFVIDSSFNNESGNSFVLKKKERKKICFKFGSYAVLHKEDSTHAHVAGSGIEDVNVNSHHLCTLVRHVHGEQSSGWICVL